MVFPPPGHPRVGNMNVLMLPVRITKGLALACLATACATDAPVPAGARGAFTGFGGDPYGVGGADPGGDPNDPSAGGFSPGGNPSTGGDPTMGGAYSTGGTWGTGGDATGGVGVAGSSMGGSGGYGLAGASSGGTGSGGAANTGGCLLPFLCAGGAGGTAGAAGSSGAAGAAGSGAVGGAGFCDNATCFDVFDCWLYFPDKTSCKFTKCEGLICKP
jgi:hypothetical protein